MHTLSTVLFNKLHKKSFQILDEKSYQVCEIYSQSVILMVIKGEIVN